MAKTKTAPLETGADPAPVVYCGPTLPKAQLVAMSIFRGGLPKHVQDLIVKTPEIGRLIVPVEKLATIQGKTRTPGTEEFRLYQAVMTERIERKDEADGV